MNNPTEYTKSEATEKAHDANVSHPKSFQEKPLAPVPTVTTDVSNAESDAGGGDSSNLIAAASSNASQIQKSGSEHIEAAKLQDPSKPIAPQKSNTSINSPDNQDTHVRQVIQSGDTLTPSQNLTPTPSQTDRNIAPAL